MSSLGTVYEGHGERPTWVAGTLTVDETAQLLGISSKTVRRRIAEWEAGNGSAWPTHVIRLGRIIRLPLVEVQAVLGVGTPL